MTDATEISSKTVPSDPTVGDWLDGLVRSGLAIHELNIAPEELVTRPGFLVASDINGNIARFKSEITSENARSYTTSQLNIYKLRNITVVGQDQVVLHDGKVIKDTINRIANWLPNSLVKQYDPHHSITFRHDVIARKADPTFTYFIGCEPAWRNYALWMRHSLPRLVAFAQHFASRDDVRLVLPAIAAGSYQEQTVKLIGIDLNKVVFVGVGEAVELQSALIMTAIDTWRIPPYVHAAAQFLINKAIGQENPGRVRRIYVQRSDGDQRRLANAAALSEVFAKFGFDAVDFGRMSVVDQIKMVRSASHIVAEHGAGLGNVIFCRPNTAVLELFNPACPQPAFWTIAGLAGCRFGFLVGEHAATNGDMEPTWNTDYTIAPAQMEAALTTLTSAEKRPSLIPMAPTMSEPETAMLAAFLGQATRHVEFGTGASTVLAYSIVQGAVTSVDSSQSWLDKVRAYCDQPSRCRLDLVLADIGPTGDWGYPSDQATRETWPAYHSAIWARENAAEADLVLVDGRFRVACFLQALLHVPAAVVLIHDFAERARYHVVHEFAREIARVDQLSAFVRRPGTTDAALRACLEQYQYDPA